MKNSIFFLILASTFLLANKSEESPMKWNVDVALTTVYDNNISDNATETAKWYLFPSMGGELEFPRINTALFMDLAFEGYLNEIEIDDVTPLIDAGVEHTFKTKKTRNKMSLSTEIFGGTDRFTIGSSEADPFLIGFVSTSMKNQFKVISKRLIPQITIEGTYRDFGKTEDNHRSGETSFDLDVIPQLTWNFRESKRSGTFKSLEMVLGWRERFAVDPEENQERLNGSISLNGKLAFLKWQCRTGGIYKRYNKKELNELTGSEENVTYSQWYVEPTIKIPLPSGFKLTLSGELSRRYSAIEKNNFSNNRGSLSLSWQGKGKR